MARSFKQKEKFTDIKSSIDTGLHVGNVKIIPKRRGELFRRLKTKEMMTLLQLYIIETDQEEESISNLIGDDDNEENEHKYQNQNDPHHMSQSLNISNISDDYPPLCSKQPENISSPFLLLDIRDKQEFDKYHIKTAKQYDMSLLRKDKLGNDIYYFKNKSDKIIIICGNEENVAIKFANELSKKYIDNLFLLATSVERFAMKFPELCVGTAIPQRKNADNEPKARLHYVEWRPSSQKHRKHKYPSQSRHNSTTAMSVISTATTRTWKP